MQQTRRIWIRLLNKITEEHINPERINKKRVKRAIRLLSHSVTVAVERFSARGDLLIECRQIIDVTELFDKLFDSLNVNTLANVKVKPFRFYLSVRAN
jgi:hypothetical protein